ncbi:stromal membrane-associated protein 1 isoform X2 [Aethina tumida]|uniref:stromal membrane-associated protein 1 isoform X2 n=1 Tax=Aethina tumida TaxID=116153 RepID=UPI002149151D|nr:stromal membrane-associated protein 1 isoform X2 [Aethina tumida]
MTSKTDKDKVKQLQDKCQSVLNGLLRDEDNKYCVDCDSKGPRWASWNIGVFLCIRCAGIHRNLGVHISKVKSVNLDTWTPEQVVSLQQMGNSRARAVYEANLPDNFRRPQSDSSLETFIRAKYEHKKYIAREWVPPALPKVNWEKEIDEEIEKQKRKKKTIVEKKSLGNVEVPQLPKPKNPSPKPARSVNNTIENKEKKDGDLLGLQNGDDSFSGFLSASTEEKKEEKPATTVDTTKNEEESFFNQTVPTEKEKVKLTKDSILALYGSMPSTNNFNQFQAPTQYPTNFPVQTSMPAQQGNYQAFGGFPQPPVQSYLVQNGMQQFPANAGTGQWPQTQTAIPPANPQPQVWNKQGQFPVQNQVQYMNQFPTSQAQYQNGPATQFSNFQSNSQMTPATNQFAQFPAQSQPLYNQPNPFFNNQTSSLQQQLGNLSLNSAPANGAATLTTNIWQ